REGGNEMNVSLQWNRNVEPDVMGYNVYRGTHPGGPYIKVNPTLVPQPPQSVKPTYSEAVPDGTYFYVVRAVNAAGESGNSNEVQVQPLPPGVPSAPTGLTGSVTVGVSLGVDGVPAAHAEGSTPLALDYILPKSTPPRDRRLSVRVVA